MHLSLLALCLAFTPFLYRFFKVTLSLLHSSSFFFILFYSLFSIRRSQRALSSTHLSGFRRRVKAGQKRRPAGDRQTRQLPFLPCFQGNDRNTHFLRHRNLSACTFVHLYISPFNCISHFNISACTYISVLKIGILPFRYKCMHLN